MRFLAPLDDDDYRALRRRAIFECCKWDPQVGDTETIARFPLVISSSTWEVLAHMAESLDRETRAMETALTERPDLMRALALPRGVRAALAPTRGVLRRRRADALTPGVARVSRYDFHPVRGGFALSEVNSDVPGGYVEASGISALMSEATGLKMVGDPAGALVDAFARAVDGGPIALAHATAYVDDAQQMEFLSRRFAEQGIEARACAPDRVDDDARALFRFFPAEWLLNLSDRPRAERWFRGGRAVSNPGQAILVQSKRLPLVFDALDVEVPTWRRLLPETRSPRALTRAERASGEWVTKPALGRVGEGIAVAGVVEERLRARIERASRRAPAHFVVQRRFDSLPVDSATGPLHVCIGVYTVDGRASGAYGRVSPRALIDHLAVDVAVLLEAS